MTTDPSTPAVTNPERPAREADQHDVQQDVERDVQQDVHHDDDADGDGGDREAARYRRRLRATESERDGLHARVEKYQRAEAERVAAETLAAPADLWMFTELADVLDDDGDVDLEKVRAAGRALLEERPRLGIAPPSVSFDGGARTSVQSGKGWADLIGGKG